MMNTFLEFADSAINPTGLCTFKNLPFKAELSECDYAVSGICFDTATSGRPGTRFAPKYVRNCYWSHMGYNELLDVDTSILNGTDYGDIPVESGYTLPTFEKITAGLNELLDGGVIPVIIGGDHSITLPELRAYKEHFGPMGLVHFDSHRDVRCFGEKYDHGTPFSRAFEEGLIDPQHVIQIGMRGGFANKEYNDFGIEAGFEVIPAYKMHEMTPDEISDAIVKKIGDVPCFITFDIDFLDPSAAPGTGTPVSGGPSTYLARKVIRTIGPKLNVKGFDLVEVLPDMDCGGVTVQAADGILVDFISTLAKRKEEGRL